MTKKLISVLLCVALVLSVTPIVYAQEISNSIVPTVTYENGNQIVEEPYIIGELTEKRTENTKHFLMSDRSVLAAVYDRSVHYKDDNAWVDIDNSLSAADENEFENKSNVFKTKFSKKSNGNKLVTITKDEFSLSWMLDDAQKVNAVVSESNTTENEDISALKNLEGVVTYPNIQNDVDLQYVVSGEDIKENIILQSANAPMEYVFTYKFNKLEYRTNENNQIEFYDESDPQKVVFVIDAPYMYDSDKAYSSDIEMQITETNNGFALTLIPNKEWLLSEDRVYPVVIDPTTLSKQEAKLIWDIEIRSTQTEAFNYKAGDFLVGTNTSGAVYRALMRFMDLPDIGVAGTVVSAKMNVTAYQGPGKTGDPALRTRPTDDIQVNIHRITALWPEQGATWNGYAGNYNSVVEDYFIYNDTDNNFMADITELVSDWYSGKYENYGIMLKANSESAANHVMQFSSSDYGINDTASATWRPILLVNYRNTIGLEDYWTYSSESLGQFGTGYVNLYNGNLTYIHNDASFNSNINGFTLSHVFNSANSYNGIGRYGNGWGLNLVQTLLPVTIEGNDSVKFVYTDGDGTKHYFVQVSDNSIIDEDGLGYTYSPITEGELIYKLTDKSGNILKFDQWGALRRIIDPNGNTIRLNYAPVPDQFNYLSSITTSSGGTIRLNYDSEYKLTSIVDNANRTTTYSYTNGNLTRITYPDGTYLRLGYSGNNLCEIILPDNKKLCYFYYPDLKISAHNVKSAANNMTAQYCFNYYSNQTEVIDLSDRKITYQFDTLGRPTCVYDNSNNIYNQTYTSNAADNASFQNNKVEFSSNKMVYIDNYLKCGAFTDAWGGWELYNPNTANQISQTTDESFVTSTTAKISNTVNATTYIKAYPLSSYGGYYTVSAYIKTDNVASQTKGAAIEVATSNGEIITSDYITGTTDEAINDGFKKVVLTFELDSGVTVGSIKVGLFEATGTLYVDSVQFEKGDTANTINILSNSSFENVTTSSALPKWFSSNFTAGTAGSVSSAEKHTGTYSLRIAGSATTKRYAYHTMNTSGNAGDVYAIGGWAKADAVANHSQTEDDFKITAGVYYTDGEYKEYPFDFNENVSDWQYVSGNFITQKPYNKILVYCSYNFNANTAYFDDLFLYRDTMQSYTYDQDGNVVNSADYAKQQSNFEYTDNNLTKLINPDGTSYEYTYDSKKNLTGAVSSNGIAYNMTYDSYGNVLTAETSSTESDSTDKITSSATYQNNGNYPHTVTDSRGNTTTYTYDTARGLPTGVTDALGNVTEYEYNAFNDRLKTVSSGSSTVYYFYNSIGQLTGIEAPSATRYAFTYDEFGNTSEIYLEQQALVENDYDTNRGLLTKSTYGNGHTIGFTYDMFDRVTAKSYNDIVKARFRYDKFGNLYETQDLFTNITYRYNYDLIGRISGINGTNGTSLNYVYDNFNRVSKYVAKIGNNTNSTEYIYGDSAVSGQKNGLIYGVKQNDVQRISYAYDELSRLSTRTLNTTTPFVTRYGYLQGATPGSTTALVKTLQNGNDVYEYAYDAVGNITEIKKNGTVYESYTYDDLGQLTLIERDGSFYYYTYDNGGNILSEGVNGVEVKTYTYGNSDWRDLLTAFNGQTITYDQIGNPLQYRDGFNFTWSNGRQLTGITKGTDNISYLYNSDGLRASKTVNGTTTDYYWLEGVLLGQKTGNDYIIYLYDENGTAYGIICNNTYYYYVFNAQGDVVGIIDQNGTQVVSYDYSAWGEVLSITGTMADTLGQTNPIRYRGYYYDNETGFYYLQSRYYDPITQRFINADGQLNISSGVHGANLFAYCENNFVNKFDLKGNVPRWIKSFGNWVSDTYKEAEKSVKKASKKIKNFGEDLSSAFEFEIGIGFGLKGGFNFLGNSLNLGAKSDAITWIIGENSKTGQHQQAEATLQLPFGEIGPNQDDWISSNGKSESNFTWAKENNSIGFGVEAYFFYGFTLDFSIDLDVLGESVVNLFE